jgi:hypothetical protein
LIAVDYVNENIFQCIRMSAIWAVKVLKLFRQVESVKEVCSGKQKNRQR